MPIELDPQWASTFAHWAPRLLSAILVLLLAWVLARGARWTLARIIDRVPGAAAHNTGKPAKETLGHQLGSLGYWLVLLIGVVAAVSILGVRGLTEAVGPLNVLVTDVAHFIPNLVGAVLIFFIGYIVATLARRVVEAAMSAAAVDRTLERAGFGRLTGATALAPTAGVVVFVFILIPAAIAALQQLGIAAISDPAVAVLATVLDALPRLLGAALVLVIAFVIARWVSALIEQILPSLGFDKAVAGLYSAGAETSSDPAVASDPAPVSIAPSKVVAQIALYAVMLFSAVEAARLLNFSVVADLLRQMLELGGQVVFGAVIITAGVLIAHFLATFIARSTGGKHGFASTLVRWSTIALATAMGLQFMGIADEIVILAFGLVLGSAAVAAALAFGLGGRDAAGRLADRWTTKATVKEPSETGQA